MAIFYSLIVPFLVVCFFMLFVLARHDFSVLRRNITLIQIFDKVLIATVVGCVLGRVVYILNSGEFYLFHFLAFFHVVRNSGFSVFGFFIGLSVASLILFRKTKIMLRMLDIILLAFFPLVILNSFIQTFVIKNMLINVGVSSLLLMCFLFLLKFNKNYKSRDGFIASIIFIVVSVVAIVSNIKTAHHFIAFLSFSQILASIVFVLSIVYVAYLKISRDS